MLKKLYSHYFLMLRFVTVIPSTKPFSPSNNGYKSIQESQKTKTDELNPMVRLFYCGEALLMSQHSIKIMNDHASMIVNSNSVKTFLV